MALVDRRASRRDPDATLEDEWARAYRTLGPILEAAARGGRRGLLEADDATQEAWLALIVRIRRYQAGGEGPEFPVWLATVVRNCLANLERGAARRRHASLDLEQADELAGREEDPAHSCERASVRESVREALAEARGHLPEPSYLIVVLRWIEGRTTLEIAEILGITPSQVRDRHRRAFPVLRRLLGRRFAADRGGFAGPGLGLDPLDREAAEVMP
jgi:RNA polymerase sigma factor (sigma-70 family)